VKCFSIVVVIITLLLASRETNFSQTVTLQWDPSSDPDVVGYNLYYGVASQVYTNFFAAGPAPMATVSNLTAGLIYYFAATAIDSAGLESTYSGEVAYQVGSPTCSIIISQLNQTYDGTPKWVSVTTVPPGLPYTVTYAGMPDPPILVGSYPVVVAITDPNYASSLKETLTISPPNASVQLDNLYQIYDGTPKLVIASTAPPNLSVSVTYNGLPDPPTDAGMYEVIATVLDPTYTAITIGTLTIAQADAMIQFGNLDQMYNGMPNPVVVATIPPGLNVVLMYDGQSQPPSAAGTYTVTGTIDDPNYTGFAMDFLTISYPGPYAPLEPISPLNPSRLNGVASQTTAAPRVILLSWTNTAARTTLWQSADLAIWAPLTNFAGASGFLSIVPQAGPLFFRATTSGPDGASPVPLSIGFTPQSPLQQPNTQRD
jgi:hypothetical protein